MGKVQHHGRITKKKATLYAAGVFFTILSLTSIKNAYGADAPEGAPTLSAYGQTLPDGTPCGVDSPTQYPCDAPPPKPLVTVPIPTCPAGQVWSSVPPVGCYPPPPTIVDPNPVVTIVPNVPPKVPQCEPNGPCNNPTPADDNFAKPCPAYGVRAEDGSCVDPHFWDTAPATTVRPAVKAPAKKVSHAVVTTPKTHKCEEDEACWQCWAMGNLKCQSLPAQPITNLVMSGESQIAFVLNFGEES